MQLWIVEHFHLHKKGPVVINHNILLFQMLWFISTGTFLWRWKCSTIQCCIFPNWLLSKSILYYEPQSAVINLQSPQSDSTPWTLTLRSPLCNFMLHAFILISAHCALWNENEYLLYLQSSVHVYFISPFAKFPKIAIHTFKNFRNSIFIYLFTLTVSVWRLVFGTPASLNLARLL